MRDFTYDFSILEPITSNNEFAEKVNPPIYDSLFSIFSWKRLLAIYFTAKYAEQGKFKDTGRYRLKLKFVGTKVIAKLTRFV